MCAKFIYTSHLKYHFDLLGLLRVPLTKNYEVTKKKIYAPHSLCWLIYFFFLTYLAYSGAMQSAGFIPGIQTEKNTIILRGHLRHLIFLLEVFVCLDEICNIHCTALNKVLNLYALLSQKFI